MKKEERAHNNKEHYNEVDNEVFDDEKGYFDKVNNDMKYDLEDVNILENHSMQKMLSLYNIKLEYQLDEDLRNVTYTCEDQLNFSWPYKKQFLLNHLINGIFTCNTIVHVIMVSVWDRNKTLYPVFQTKYIIIRSPDDVTYFLRQSMIDIKSRIRKFTKKLDGVKDGTVQVILGTDWVDSGIDYEKLNIVKIQNVFANGYTELPTRITNTKSSINIKNEDNKCFLHCHLLHERYRLCGYKIIKAERLYGGKAFIYDDNKMINLDYEGIKFPIPYNVY